MAVALKIKASWFLMNVKVEWECSLALTGPLIMADRLSYIMLGPNASPHCSMYMKVRLNVFSYNIKYLCYYFSPQKVLSEYNYCYFIYKISSLRLSIFSFKWRNG